ncbi:hypothetical protein [Geodermatophilus sp. DSM 44513]|uniref:hypothetical protein n=1 Tax=Geodermatophilus sp. DSM 44513 TaxID=1528104 RepID=UPI001412D13B|nr:hypothetical protein [Geodermatophilus sp. DSM 44513]WNV76536.1 hypothetical protein RTG05_04505 [Geodermatophilus sp. DSM 44513]
MSGPGDPVAGPTAVEGSYPPGAPPTGRRGTTDRLRIPAARNSPMDGNPGML